MDVATKTVLEPGRDLEVVEEAQVLVVGGGPAGVSAALASARLGVDTLLVERYGYLGGLATGGLVLLIMPMSDADGQLWVRGICEELVERLHAIGGALYPARETLGSEDKQLVQYWVSRGCRFFAPEGRIVFNVLLDPELFKCVLNELVGEAGVRLLFHSWASNVIIDGNRVRGVVIESKSGRQAVLCEVVIDATGDGDLCAFAQVPFETKIDPHLRSSKLAFVFRVANVDLQKLLKFKLANHAEYEALMREVESLGGFSMWLPTSREDSVWFNNFISGLTGLSVKDLTKIEVEGRKRMLLTHNFFKKKVPGFEKSYIADTASQTGVRATRRLIGRYVLTKNDIDSGIPHPDTVAVFPARQWVSSLKSSLVYFPYRCLLPSGVENLLVAGRCFSGDDFAQDVLSPIQCCIAMGQAAGTAAALCLREKVNPANLAYDILKKHLVANGVPLPD